MTSAPKRAGLYLRVSTSHQATENQRPEVEQLARTRGYKVVDVFEESISAAKERAQFNRMMVAAHTGKLDVIVVWSIDRFGRSMLGNIQAIIELDRVGVEVVSIREPWLDSGGPTRSLLIAIISWVAEQERERIRARVRSGLERAKREGTKLGRPQVYVDLIRARLLKGQGLSLRNIAHQLGVSDRTLRRSLKDAEQRGAAETPELEGSKATEIMIAEVAI